MVGTSCLHASAANKFRAAGLWHCIEPRLYTAQNVWEMVLSLFNSIEPEKLHWLGMVLWSIGKARNNRIWEQIEDTAETIWHHAKAAWEEWNLPRISRSASHRTTSMNQRIRWSCPKASWMKLNVDARTHAGLNASSYGLCLRDEKEEFQYARTGWCHPEFEAHVAEAYALMHAVELAQELELDAIVFVFDSLEVVNAMKSSNHDISEFGTIITYCKTLCSSLSNYRIEFVKRGANVAAHTLARLATTWAPLHDFIGVPSCIAAIISNETS